MAETVNLTCTRTVGNLTKDYNLTIVSASANSKGAVFIDDKSLLIANADGQTNVLDYVTIGSSTVKYKYTMYFKPIEIAGIAYGAGRTETAVEISRATGKAWIYTNRYGSDLMTITFGATSNDNETCRLRSANKF